jgi:sulfatase maturation enzyme AslB (radical SAM superfamily)
MVKGAHNKVVKSDGTSYSCQDDFTQEAWNSQYMRQLRTDMIQNKPITGCDVCYQQEANGRTSNRQHSIMEWNNYLGTHQLDALFAKAKDNDGYLDTPPVYLDLRLGNLCNLKCRMCNPWNSSQIVKEHLDIADGQPEYVKVWEKTFGKFPVNVMKDQEWFDSDIMWDQVIALIPTLKKVYMTGGEPTLIKNNFKFMEECIAQRRTDIVLFFNTNCTNVNKRFLDLIKQFDKVHINASLDGTGIVNDYIRAPSDWAMISSNVERLAELPNVVLGITPTIQVYNIYNIVDLIKWVEDLRRSYNKDIFIDFLINHHPLHLNTNILPRSMTEQALSDILAHDMSGHHQMTVDSLKGLIGHLQQPQSANAAELLERFKTYTLALDQERGQSLLAVDSRLGALL